MTISIIKHRIKIVSIHTIFNHSLAKYTIFKNQSLFLIYKNIYQAEDGAEEGCDTDNERVEENFIIKPRSGTRIHLLRYFSSRIYLLKKYLFRGFFKFVNILDYYIKRYVDKLNLELMN